MLNNKLPHIRRDCHRFIKRLLYRQLTATSFGKYSLVDNKLNPLTSTEWIDKFFNDNKLQDCILPIKEIKSKFGKSCIINDPADTLNNRYFGGHLRNCDKILSEALVKAPSTRLKPLVVTVRGVGGGKTRLFEELRFLQNDRQDTVALSITFNNKMDYCKTTELFVTDRDYVELNFMLSILLRIATTVYDVSISQLRIYVRQAIYNLSLDLMVDSNLIESFGRHFLQRMIHDIDISLRKDSPNNFLKNLPVFIDEVMVFKDALSSNMPDTENRFVAAVSMLSKVFLNTRFRGCDSSTPVNTCLAISSLDALALGKTKSLRSIFVLTVPERLDVREVVLQWWTPHLDKLHPIDMFRLTLIAETVITQPRVLSFVSDFIKSKTSHDVPMRSPFVNGTFVKDLFNCVLVLLDSQYTIRTKEDVSPAKLMSLVFGDEEILDAASAKMIRKSIFTNSLQRIAEKTTFAPTGSLLMLAAASYDKLMKSPSDLNILNPFDCFYMLFERTVSVITGDKKIWKSGDTLESLTEWWLTCRIAAAVTAGAKSIPLARLLPMVSSSVEVSLPSSENYFETPSQWPTLTGDSVTDFAKCFNETNLLDVDFPFIMYQSSKGQGFDRLISFLVKKTDGSLEINKAFLVFMDEKSSAVRVGKNEKAEPKKLDCRQYERVQSLANELRRLRDEENLPLSLESQALVEGQYKFVYTTTYKDVRSMVKRDRNLVVCDEKAARKFFGIMWPFVCTVRSPSSE